jgi:MFS family permease
MAPQGVGAAMVMPIAGRLTDRIGGGPIALVGIIVMTLGTLPFAFIGADTPYWLLAGLLVVRGFGMGGAMMPSMAAAYAMLTPAAVPRATSAITVLRQVGGSIGTALLAVVLQGQIRNAVGGNGGLQTLPENVRTTAAAPLADAFAHTFWWALGMSAIALIPATILVLSTRKGGRYEYAPGHGLADEAAPAVHGGA